MRVPELPRSAAGQGSRTRGGQRSTVAVAADFLFATAHLSEEETGALAGVSPPTVRRWRLCGVRLVRERVRLRMLAHLAGEGSPAPDGEDGDVLPGREGAGGGARGRGAARGAGHASTVRRS